MAIWSHILLLFIISIFIMMLQLFMFFTAILTIATRFYSYFLFCLKYLNMFSDMSTKYGSLNILVPDISVSNIHSESE